MSHLKGKVAVVTGASKGIGAGIAKSLAEHGASVVVNYSSSKKDADTVVDQITKAGGKAKAIGGSVAKPAEIKNLFDETKKTYGKVDILVNNAGIYSFEPIENVTPEHIASLFDVNVKGLLLATRAAIPLFPAEGGSIINIGSIVAEAGPPGASVYSATKGAVNTITKVLSKELGPKKIRVNAVNPGVIDTEGFRASPLESSGLKEEAARRTPLGRIGEPEDVAGIVTFLASDEARWVNGSLIDAAGGWN